VPGGDVVVTITSATSYLRGPSVLVARGELADAWWNAQVGSRPDLFRCAATHDMPPSDIAYDIS
jgi:hypothetical protein